MIDDQVTFYIPLCKQVDNFVLDAFSVFLSQLAVIRDLFRIPNKLGVLALILRKLVEEARCVVPESNGADLNS